jgi:hypothetical protein
LELDRAVARERLGRSGRDAPRSEPPPLEWFAPDLARWDDGRVETADTAGSPDGRRFTAVENAGGEVGADTVFEYYQVDDLVWAR